MIHPADQPLHTPGRIQFRVRLWRELSIFSLFIMEMSWFTPWFIALRAETPGVSEARTFLVWMIIGIISYANVRGMNILRIKLAIRRVVVVAALMVGTFYALWQLLYFDQPLGIVAMLLRPIQAVLDITVFLPNEFLVILAVFYVWGRGIALAQVHIGPLYVLRRLQWGLLLYLLLFGLVYFFTGQTTSNLLYLFLISGLVATASSRISMMGTMRGSRRVPFDYRWLLAMISTIVITIVIAAGVGTVVAGFGSGLVRLVLTILFTVFVIIMAPLMIIFVYLIIWVFDRLLFEELSLPSEFLDGLSRLRDALLTLFEEYIDINSFLDMARNFLLTWGTVIEFVFYTVCVLLLVGWILFRLRVLAERTETDIAEDLQSVGDRGGTVRSIRDNIVDRFRDVFAQLTNLRYGKRLLSAVRIRWIYAQLMELCRNLEHPRPAAQTPLEFIPTMTRLFPTCAPELDLLTDAYLRVRYGELPEQSQEIEQVEDAWRRIREIGKRKRSELKRQGRKKRV